MAMAVMEQKRKIQESQNYQRTKMQKDMVIQRLKDDGCRITKQRLMLLDIILEEDCSCCKEIYYKAAKQDGRIGTAVKKGNDKLAAEIDTALAELKKNGEYDKIYKTWFGEVKK